MRYVTETKSEFLQFSLNMPSFRENQDNLVKTPTFIVPIIPVTWGNFGQWGNFGHISVLLIPEVTPAGGAVTLRCAESTFLDSWLSEQPLVVFYEQKSTVPSGVESVFFYVVAIPKTWTLFEFLSHYLPAPSLHTDLIFLLSSAFVLNGFLKRPSYTFSFTEFQKC